MSLTGWGRGTWGEGAWEPKCSTCCNRSCWNYFMPRKPHCTKCFRGIPVTGVAGTGAVGTVSVSG